MKKYILIIAILIISFIASAQISVGGKIGPVGFAYQYGSNIDGSNLVYSYMGGVTFNIQIIKWFSLQTEVNYERKGFHNSNDDFSFTFNKDASKFNYLTIPLFLQFNTLGKVKFYGQIGPYIGFLLSAKTKLEGTDPFGNYYNIDYDLKDSYKSIDFGLAEGIGVLFPLSDNLSMNIESRGGMGFINTLDPDNKSNKKPHNMSWHLIFGLLYTFN